MVSSWLYFFQRSDINLRNEWSNYTNWAYSDTQDSGLILAPELTSTGTPGPGSEMIYITGNYDSKNQREILETFGIVLDGDYRENVMPSGVYDYVEKYIRTDGFAKPGIYCYNFCLHTSPFEYQPSGALNMSRFKNIEFEFTTYIPPLSKDGSEYTINCDPVGNPISISTKPAWSLYQYNYDITIYEERFNILSFIGGNCALMYAR
jgi:hypothetical protein